MFNTAERIAEGEWFSIDTRVAMFWLHAATVLVAFVAAFYAQGCQ